MIYLACFLSTLIYAVVLSTPLGRRFTDRQTWATVVFGVVIVVGCVAIEDMEAATLTATMFLAGGGPIIARSLILDFIRDEASVKKMIGD